MRVLMIIAPKGFRDEELIKPKQLLEQEEYKVVIASKGVAAATGVLGNKVKVDLDISKVKINDYDAILFIGGAGAKVYFNDETILNIAKDAFKYGKVLGAICIAPSILANAGLLKNKRATSFPSEKENLEAKGAIFASDAVTTDGRIVTANGPQAAEEFGLTVINLLNKRLNG